MRTRLGRLCLVAATVHVALTSADLAAQRWEGSHLDASGVLVEWRRVRGDVGPDSRVFSGVVVRITNRTANGVHVRFWTAPGNVEWDEGIVPPESVIEDFYPYRNWSPAAIVSMEVNDLSTAGPFGRLFADILKGYQRDTRFEQVMDDMGRSLNDYTSSRAATFEAWVRKGPLSPPLQELARRAQQAFLEDTDPNEPEVQRVAAIQIASGLALGRRKRSTPDRPPPVVAEAQPSEGARDGRPSRQVDCRRRSGCQAVEAEPSSDGVKVLPPGFRLSPAAMARDSAWNVNFSQQEASQAKRELQARKLRLLASWGGLTGAVLDQALSPLDETNFTASIDGIARTVVPRPLLGSDILGEIVRRWTAGEAVDWMYETSIRLGAAPAQDPVLSQVERTFSAANPRNVSFGLRRYLNGVVDEGLEALSRAFGLIPPAPDGAR